MSTTLHSFIDIFDSEFETDGTPVKIKKIVIPIIQRDYAQGRENPDVNRMRTRFLSSLHDAIDKQHPITLDFVYGDVDGNGIMTPLDGQQRLTTLFLFHWKEVISKNETETIDAICSFKDDKDPSQLNELITALKKNKSGLGISDFIRNIEESIKAEPSYIMFSYWMQKHILENMEDVIASGLSKEMAEYLVAFHSVIGVVPDWVEIAVNYGILQFEKNNIASLSCLPVTGIKLTVHLWLRVTIGKKRKMDGGISALQNLSSLHGTNCSTEVQTTVDLTIQRRSLSSYYKETQHLPMKYLMVLLMVL